MDKPRVLFVTGQEVALGSAADLMSRGYDVALAFYEAGYKWHAARIFDAVDNVFAPDHDWLDLVPELAQQRILLQRQLHTELDNLH